MKDKYTLEIVVVDDGSIKSIDDSVKKFVHHFNVVKVENKINAGKGNAVRRGVVKATGKYIIYTDSDLPYENIHISEHIALLEKGDDIVVTIRDKTYYDTIPFQRRFISKFVQSIIKLLFRLPTADTQGGLKSMNLKGKEILINTKIDGYLFDLEFIKEASKQKLKIGYVHGKLKSDVVVKKIDITVLFRELYNLMYILK